MVQRLTKYGTYCKLYTISGYFHKVQIFTNFINVPTTHENLFWVVSSLIMGFAIARRYMEYKH